MHAEEHVDIEGTGTYNVEISLKFHRKRWQDGDQPSVSDTQWSCASNSSNIRKFDEISLTFPGRW